MELLIISDSHGNISNIRSVLNKHKNIKIVVHLGDGYSDIETVKNEFKDITFFNVCGNCDIGYSNPTSLVKLFNNKVFLLTHGHKFNVKETLDDLVKEAKEQNASVVLFGHTHVPLNKTIGNILLFNPGTLKHTSGLSYGIITVGENKLVAKHLFL